MKEYKDNFSYPQFVYYSNPPFPMFPREVVDEGVDNILRKDE